MFKWFFIQSASKTESKSGFLKVAEKELEKNREVIESLRDYDAGKKTISTADVERSLRSL